MINSGQSEERGERDATYRSKVKNVKPGEIAVIPLDSAKVFSGTVTAEDSGKPIPHATITIWASQEEFGSSAGLRTKADENGNYKLAPLPGIRFGVVAIPPKGQPYLAKKVDDIVWEDGGLKRTENVTVPKGVLVRGQILDGDSGKPVIGASITYLPERKNNESYRDEMITGWQVPQESDEEGQFEIAVLPGPGRLLVHGGRDTNFVQHVFGSSELYRGEASGTRNYTHALIKVNPDRDSETIDLDPVKLKSGQVVKGSVVNEKGEPAKKFVVHSTLGIDPISLDWGPFARPSFDGKFELRGVAENTTYTVHILDAENKQGATLKLKAGEAPVVKLKPMGKVKMVFVDQDSGKPIEGYEPNLMFLMTPAASEIKDPRQAELDGLDIESTFATNVDRSQSLWLS